MNEERISEYLSEYITSINDMPTPAFETYKEKFMNENSKIINKHLSISKRFRQALSRKMKCFDSQDEEFLRKETKFCYTRICLGQNKVLVPIEFNCMMEAILTKNMSESGLFRKSTSFINLERCLGFINDTDTYQMYKLDIINKLVSFDIITLTAAFKKLFDNFKTTVIPQQYIDMLLGISKIDDMFDKVVLLKYIIYSIPKSNRNILDSITQFFSLIQYLITSPELVVISNMDMHGFAVVIMPKVLLCSKSKVDLKMVNDLVDVMEFILRHRMILFSVGTEKIKENSGYYISYYDSGIVAKTRHRDEEEEELMEEENEDMQ